MIIRSLWSGPTLLMLLLTASPLAAGDPTQLTAGSHVRQQTFDVDPQWDGFRNRLLPDMTEPVVQDFGWSCSRHAGGRCPGEIGGWIQRSLTPARYSRKLDRPLSLDDHLTASGTMAVRNCRGHSGALLGWFHESSDGWRTPNAVAMRVDGNGDRYWLFAEYGSRSRLTGGVGAFEGERYQTTPTEPFRADGTVHRWQLRYQPSAGNGNGEIQFQIDERINRLPVSPEARRDGAVFNRFGLWNQQATGSGLELWVDDVVVNGEVMTFNRDPSWIGEGHRTEHAERVIRPHHLFGYSDTNHAGGAPGELGGIIWRDEQPSYYAAPVGRLTLNDPLEASGTLALCGAGADSAVYIGWFNSAAKMSAEQPEYEQRQRHYLGALLEGPSRIGHYFRPGYGTADRSGSNASKGPVVLPDCRVHQWTIRYEPLTDEGTGRIRVALDGRETVLTVPQADRQTGAVFDRFGVFNMQSGGWHVEFYLDNLQYTDRTTD